MKQRSLLSGASASAAGGLLIVQLCLAPLAFSQAAPGPYEILPFSDGFITEAYMDLLDWDSAKIADWSGWYATSWESPNAYNGHGGTDWALDTGTPLYAPAAGTVVEMVNNIPENNHTLNYYGNYVKLQVSGGTSPNGEPLDVIVAHMLPTIQVTLGQNVATGQLLGYSDNTGQSTSEHVHLESRVRNASAGICPFYHGHFKYPVMFNPAGTKQVGHVIQVTAASTPIRADRFETSAQITTAHQNQLYFASYWKRGFYRVFIPNDPSNRSGWIKALDAAEVYTGTVIQALPDTGQYSHAATLQTPLAIKATPDAGAATLGQIVYGGGRFVADQVQAGWYRVPLPGASATWGWVQAGPRLLVYPQLHNPAINLSNLPNNDFPLQNNFTVVGMSTFGRAKYNRSFVKSFSPAAPGGDGNALFITDANNHGNGYEECVTIGKVDQRNYFVQVHVYFNYQPSYLAKKEYERYGIFARDDGFASMDRTFEGKGNCYALLYDNVDGRVWACKIVDAVLTDFLPIKRYVTTSGWNSMRIEAEEDTIRYYLNGELLIAATDSTFPSGPAGMGYSYHKNTTYPPARGAYFDNFIADAVNVSPSPSPTASPTIEPSPSASPSPTASGDVPAAPSNLTATAVSSTQINLAWQDNSGNEDNFVLERKKGSAAYSVIATLPANTTSYNNTGLSKNTTYTYRVKAVNAQGSSAYSNEASAKTPR